MRSKVPLVGKEEPQDHPDQETYWLETSKIPLLNGAGEVIGILGTYSDITERKLHQQRMEYFADHDALTGLPNRRSLEKALEAERGQRNWSALLFLDLDQFKAINDTLGHDVGDDLLVAIATRLRNTVDLCHLTSRIGGDEFGILASNLGESELSASEAATALASQLVTAISQPFEIGVHCLYVGVSIGISIIAPLVRNFDRMFVEADLAMYTAKAAGHNNVCLYEQKMASSASRRHALQNRLRQFTSQHSLSLVYQPQFSAENELAGCEALLRWNDAELGEVSPVEFIELAEQTGLIHEIGDWVAEEAFRQLAEWASSKCLPKGFSLAINVSVVQFQRPDFTDRLIQAAERHGVDKAVIELEITESLPLGREMEVLNSLHLLKQSGFKLAMDDFGTGYSSLAFLTQMPLDRIKIDRSFVSRISEDARHTKIGQTIIDMAENLAVPVVAEGVETSEELQFLKGMGCDYFQGFHFSRGIAAEQFHGKYLQVAVPPA